MIEKSCGKNLKYSFTDIDSEKKLRNLILYVANQCINDPTFGKTKLNKILYFADFKKFKESGKPISGAEYYKDQFGPVPKIINALQQEMVAEGDIIIKSQQGIDHDRHKIIAINDPDLSGYSVEDISIIDEFIRLFWGKTATEVSNMSHGKAWHIVDYYESIPYETAYVSDEPITEDDIEATNKMASEYDWSHVYA